MKELAKSGDLSVDLAAAFDASPNPYMLLTPELRYAGMNRAYLDVTQRTREELIGSHIMDAFDGGGDAENAQRLLGSFQRVLATNQADRLPLLHYAIPLPDGQGGRRYVDRYWSCTHSPVHGPDGRLRYILQHTTDVTELHQLREWARKAGPPDVPSSALDAIVGGRVLKQAEQVQEDNRRLISERDRMVEMFMQAPGFVAVLTGSDHVVERHNEAYARLIGHRAIVGKSVRQGLPELEDQGYFDFLDSVFETGEPFEGRERLVQLQNTPGAALEDVYLNFIYQPIRDSGGQVVGIFVQGHDVTASVLAAQRQKLMIDELNHRVKNTLATVQSIAMQTARSNTEPRAFAESFQARLMSLSHTHDLLTRSHWEGAELGDILRHETEAHGSSRVLPNGPLVALKPAAALSLGMIFHELATNAAKYGALSTPTGRVMVDWSLSSDGELVINWTETGGPAVNAPERRGFGTRMIERNVRHDLAGSLELNYLAGGMIARITVPMDRD